MCVNNDLQYNKHYEIILHKKYMTSISNPKI